MRPELGRLVITCSERAEGLALVVRQRHMCPTTRLVDDATQPVASEIFDTREINRESKATCTIGKVPAWTNAELQDSRLEVEIFVLRF